MQPAFLEQGIFGDALSVAPDLANGVKVEAGGKIVNGVLKATKIGF